MRRMTLCIIALLATSMTVSAFNLLPEQVGIYAAVPMGGQIDDGTGGIGIRSEFALKNQFLLEIDLTWSRESSTRGFSITEVEQDLISLAASLMYRHTAGEDVDLYYLCGLGYYVATATADSSDIDIEMDNTLGYHVGLGAVSRLPFENWELFIEYRYTLLELEGTWSLPGSILGETRSNDFGLIKIGVNRAF